MPYAKVRGVNINYQVLGNTGPWVALSPGGRRDLGGIQNQAGKLAELGYRVVIFDRRNSALPTSSSTATSRSTRSGPTTFMNCSASSAPFRPSSAAARQAAALPCSSRFVIPSPCARFYSGA